MKPNWIKNLIKDESGATAIEYGLIAAVMATLVIGAYSALGGSLTESFTALGEKLKDPPVEAGGS
jgi:pilus assembly protein Flp/PilA